MRTGVFTFTYIPVAFEALLQSFRVAGQHKIIETFWKCERTWKGKNARVHLGLIFCTPWQSHLVAAGFSKAPALIFWANRLNSGAFCWYACHMDFSKAQEWNAEGGLLVISAPG